MITNLMDVNFSAKPGYAARGVKPVFRVGFMLCIGLVLNACGGGKFEDIDQFMAQVKAETPAGIKTIPATELYQPYAYGASNLRSPFVPPVVVPSLFESADAARKTGVSPPKNHVKQHLEEFDIVALQMVGTMQKNDTVWGLIEDSERRVHRVGLGDYIGMHWGRVKAINSKQIDFIEIVSDGADGWLLKPNFIGLKSASE